MKKITKILLLLIIALAFFLRVYQVTSIPPSLNWDEVSIGYNAYSIMQTGKDEWNMPFPLHFKSYGEYKLPAQIYASIPGIAVFGLNEFGVRITPVVYGTLTILLLFFLTKSLFEDEIISLISAFLLAISPWHIQLTRASFESSFSVFWVVMGMWFLVKGFKDKKWLIVSMIPFAISFYTYNSARVFTPLFLLAILFIYRKTLFKFKKEILLSILLFAILLAPSIPFLLNHGDSRYKLVSVTDDPGLIPRVDQARNESTLPTPLKKIIYRKETYIAMYMTENYLAHFTPGFLFVTGAPHHQHNVQNMGELYWFQLPFVLLGLYFLFKKKNPWRWFLLSWLLIAFIPVSVTNDSIPNALRTVIAAPFYQIITALGIVGSLEVVKKNKYKFSWIIIGFLIVVGTLNLGFYLYQYYAVYPVAYSRDWQYGYKQAVEYVDAHKDAYDKIYFTNAYGQPYIFNLFFMQYPPSLFQNDSNLIRGNTNTFTEVSQFSKFYFIDFKSKGSTFADIAKINQNKKILFVGTPGDFPPNLRRLDQIYFLNGNLDFEIVASPQ